MSLDPKTRRVVSGVSVALLTLTVPFVGASSASVHPQARHMSTVPARSGSPTSTVDHVANFYGAYVDVLHDTGHNSLANSLRHQYLTAGLRKSLAQWESAHHRDGVLRSKAVPSAWKVTYQDSGMGHCWTVVRLTWRDARHRTHHSYLTVQSDVASRDISGIEVGSAR
ncbi:hypothetical protein [Streptomyces atriruber]|uniref:hypothetical protein n=1 Tax=Streptomyces atriruber TaxID=545121 RepID=UPI000B1EB2F1|nr:hypothetical protein [Streptomyces atriruber]